MNVINQERQKLRELAHGFYFSCGLYATVRIGLADALFHEAKTPARLALELNADADALKRLISFMISINVFENCDEKIKLTESGKFLTSNHANSLAKEISMFSGGETYQAWGNVMTSLRTGKPAFNDLYGKSLFEYFSDHKETAERFHSGWQEITASTAKEFVQTYKFLSNDKIIDVGSGYGIFLCTIIQNNQHLSGALYDLPVSLEGAPEIVKRFGLQDKVSIIPGDASKSVPSGYTVHLLKSVIHNCTDEQSIQMLAHCASALTKGGKVLIVERVVQAGDDYLAQVLSALVMLIIGAN